MNTTDLRQLAANTPVSDRRRYVLRWAADEIDKLNARLDFAKAELTKGTKTGHIILQDASERQEAKAIEPRQRIKIITATRHNKGRT